MKLSNRDTLALQGVLDYEQIPKNDIELVKFISKRKEKEHIIANIDALMKAKGEELLSKKLKTMRVKGKPTSIKELAVNGDDLMAENFRGEEIGDTLNFLLETAIKTGKNNKDFLMREAKSRLNKSSSWRNILKC